MATTRPFMQLGIGDLEDIFERQGKNFATLARLKHELSHRQVPRAVALLERIKKAEALLEDLQSQRPDPKSPSTHLQLKTRSPATAPDSAPQIKSPGMPPSASGLQIPTDQPDLLAGLQPPPPEPTRPKPTSTAATDVAPIKMPATTTESDALPQLALDDACRILKVGVSDAWEKVEAARRKLVMKSNPLATTGLPATQAQKLLSEARVANDAAIVIAARRSGRQ